MGVTLKASGDFPQAPFDAAQAQLAAIGVGGATKDGWYYNVPLADATDAQLSAALERSPGRLSIRWPQP